MVWNYRVETVVTEPTQENQIGELAVKPVPVNTVMNFQVFSGTAHLASPVARFNFQGFNLEPVICLEVSPVLVFRC